MCKSGLFVLAADAHEAFNLARLIIFQLVGLPWIYDADGTYVAYSYIFKVVALYFRVTNNLKIHLEKKVLRDEV